MELQKQLSRSVEGPNEERFQEFEEVFNNDNELIGFTLLNDRLDYLYYLDEQGGWYDENGHYYNSDGKNVQPPKDSLKVYPTQPISNITTEQLLKRLSTYPDTCTEVKIQFSGFNLRLDDNKVEKFFKSSHNLLSLEFDSVNDGDQFRSGFVVVKGAQTADAILRRHKYSNILLYIDDFQYKISQEQNKMDEFINTVQENQDNVELTFDFTGFPVGTQEQEIRSFFGEDAGKLAAITIEQNAQSDYYEQGTILVKGVQNTQKLVDYHGKSFEKGQKQYCIYIRLQITNYDFSGFDLQTNDDGILAYFGLKNDDVISIELDDVNEENTEQSGGFSILSGYKQKEIISKNNTTYSLNSKQFTVLVGDSEDAESDDDDDDDDYDSDNDSQAESQNEEVIPEFDSDSDYDYGYELPVGYEPRVLIEDATKDTQEQISQKSLTLGNVHFGFLQNIVIHMKRDNIDFKELVKRAYTSKKKLGIFFIKVGEDFETCEEVHFNFIQAYNMYSAYLLQIIQQLGGQLSINDFYKEFDPRKQQDQYKVFQQADFDQSQK